MSIRTIIEINHDQLNDLMGANTYIWHRLLRDLAACDLTDSDRSFLASRGIRVLGQRHHSEPEWTQPKP